MHSEFTDEDSEWEDLLNLKIFHEAVCLISTNRHLSLEIEEDAVRELESINKEINVVAITGLYRTGKSVLLNQLAAANRDRFGVGHATAAMTLGIWATCVRHPNHEDQVLMLLDTEGLGDIKKGNKNHDIKLFTIATLLSSTLIYNVMGTFNQDALEKLSFIAQFSDNVVLSKESENEDKLIDSTFPTFVLCMRDFFLTLQNPSEVAMTPKDYLEDCLQSKYSENRSDDTKFNALRDAIKRYFHRRHCFTFERPTADPEDLKKLDSASSVTFTDGFKDDLKNLTDFVYQCKPKMMLNGSKTMGKGLVSLARTYVQCIREGDLPSVGDAMMHVAEEKNRKLIENAMTSFTSKINQIQLPESNYPKLDSLFKQYEGEEIRTFREEIIYDENNKCLYALKEQLDEAWHVIVVKNKRILLENCLEELEKLHAPISKDVVAEKILHTKSLKDEICRKKESTIIKKNQLEVEVNSLRKELIGMKKEMDEQEKENTELRGQMGIEESTNAELLMNLENQTKEMVSTKDKNIELETRLKQQEKNLESTKVRNTELHRQMEQQKKKLESKKVKNSELELQLLQQEQTLQSKEVKIRDLKSQLLQQEQKLQSKEVKIRELELQLLQQEQKLQSKEVKIRDLELQLLRQQAEFNRAASEKWTCLIL